MEARQAVRDELRDGTRGLDKIRHMAGAGEVQAELADFLTNDFRMELRDAEAGVVARIDVEVERQVGPLFQEANAVVESFYRSVYAYEPVDDGTGEMKPKLSPEGRPIEDWGRLTQAQVDATVWSLQRVLWFLQDKLATYESTMKFAFTIWDDEYHAAYRQPPEGTIQDRTSFAKRSTRDSRYYYLYSWLMFRAVESKVQAIRELSRKLEFGSQRMARDGGSRSNFKYG